MVPACACSLFSQRPHQVGQAFIQRIDNGAHIEPHVGCHLVIARPRRMEPARRFTHQFFQPRFHVHVDVFQRRAEIETAIFDFGFHRIEALGNCCRIRLAENALLGQHGGMGLGASDILGIKALVETDRGVDFSHDGGRTAGKAATPHAIRAGPLIGLGHHFSQFSGEPHQMSRSKMTKPFATVPLVIVILLAAAGLYWFNGSAGKVESPSQSAAATEYRLTQGFRQGSIGRFPGP